MFATVAHCTLNTYWNVRPSEFSRPMGLDCSCSARKKYWNAKYIYDGNEGRPLPIRP